MFSGDDATTSPYDASYLADLGEALKNQHEIQILFRQVPVETTKRYQAVLDKYPHIKHIPPEWTSGQNWNISFPKYDDINLLINLAKHCSTVVNVGSTMALDFSNFNVPGLFINYNQPTSANWSVEIIYKFQHFRSMAGLDPVGWVNSKDEIAEKVKLAIDHPEKIGPDRKKWLERIVQPNTNKTASQCIVEAITNNL